MTATIRSILRTASSVLAVGAFVFATSAVVSKVTAATPGQVGNTPRCTVTAIGARGSAFHPSGNSTTVKFRVTGSDSCKVRVSANSFYAPSMNGKPYSKQILYQRVTKTFTRGTHNMTVGLPTKSTPAKGCYYQVDLTYGVQNHTPVLAYGHGKIPNCGKKPPTPQPKLLCNSLTFAVVPEKDKTYRFTAAASASNTKITKYVFSFGDGDSQTVPTSNTSASTEHTYGEADHEYTATVAVSSSDIKNVTSAACKVTFKTPPTPKSPQLICESLQFERVGSSSTSYDFTGRASAQDTAITAYHFDFGDGNTETITTGNTTATTRHSYESTAKNYTAMVTVDSEDAQDVTSAACKVSITGKTPPVLGVTTELPNTGPGDIAGFFAATAAVGALIHRFVLRRKIS